MEELIKYVTSHAERGACQCGKCIDAPTDAQALQPSGHTADLVFFKVSANGGSADELAELVMRNRKGEFADVNLLDGNEHSYIEVGGWIGDQGLAMMLMGLGALLGLWKLLTPKSIFGNMIDEATAMQMAGSGLVSIKS